MFEKLPPAVKFSKKIPTLVGAYLIFKPCLTRTQLKFYGFTSKQAAARKGLSAAPDLVFIAKNTPTGEICLYRTNGAIIRATDKAIKDSAWVYLGWEKLADHALLFKTIKP